LSECVVPLLSGEARVAIDLRFRVMVIPLDLLYAGFLDELGLFLRRKAKQTYRTKAPWTAALSMLPFHAMLALPNRRLALETNAAVNSYLGRWEFEAAYALFIAPLRLVWRPANRMNNPATISVTYNYQVWCPSNRWSSVCPLLPPNSLHFLISLKFICMRASPTITRITGQYAGRGHIIVCVT
jgi:hypothetical protein